MESNHSDYLHFICSITVSAHLSLYNRYGANVLLCLMNKFEHTKKQDGALVTPLVRTQQVGTVAAVP